MIKFGASVLRQQRFYHAVLCLVSYHIDIFVDAMDFKMT